MQKLMKDYLEELRRQKKRRRKAAVAVVLLVVLVVGTVTSGLTQYGVAMTGDYKCGLEEHKHTDECYEDVLICGYKDTDGVQEGEASAEDPAGDPEDSSDQTDASEPEKDEAGQPETQSDAPASQEGHQHTEDCYEVEDVLDCGLEESEGHTHDEGCYETEDVLICEEDENEGHTHDETCYETEEVLDCKEDHEHTEDCYKTESTLTCGLEESEGHTHGKDCYESESVLTCKEEESEGHTHSKGCYKQEKVLKCGKEESKEEQTKSIASEEASSDLKADITQDAITDPEIDETQHVHTEECYERQLVCDLEEHAHTDECLIDKTADVEDVSVWDAQYADVEWTGSWSEDLVTAAKMQIGYRESTDNYQIAEDGSHQGYTRYGEFCGEPYADWDAAFVNFCMYYAGLSESGLFPDTIDTVQWMEQFAELNEQSNVYLSTPADHVPAAGDLIFFESGEEEEKETRIGIVSAYEEEKDEIQVIEGNSGDEVRENTYGADDNEITVYLKIRAFEDVEDASVWDAQYADVEWKDVWGEDLVMAAQMQIGYQESQNNYQIAEDGSHKGYSRYGAFAGDAYADWDAAFVNFCMHYAGLSTSRLFPAQMDADDWYKEFQEINVKNGDYLAPPEEYVPVTGDLVFFQAGEAEQKTRMGIVSSFLEEANEIQVIEGNSDNEVKENTYSATDSQIMSYLKITELESVYKGNLLRYEDDQVEILVTAIEENAIPEGVELKVVPIVKDAEETQAQYQAIEEQLQEKVSQSAGQEELIFEQDDTEDETLAKSEDNVPEENEMTESDEEDDAGNEDVWLDDHIEADEEIVEEVSSAVVGFLAYDISFIDKNGVEVEPAGNVSVAMRYKNAVLPDGIEESADELYVTVMHLEEDGAGAVKEVVDLAESKQLKEISTTENNEIQSVEFETASFSAIVLTWTDSETTTYSVSASKAAAKAATMSPPVHHKYIKRNAATDGSTNTYTVSLDVQGKVETKNVDVVLIVDASSSMTHDDNKNANRVQNAVTQLVKDAKASCPDTVTINLGIVEFSTGFDQKGDYDYGSPYKNWYYTSKGTEKAITGEDSDFPATKYGNDSKIPNNAYKKPDKTPDAKTAKSFGKISNLKSDYKYKISGYGVATNWQAGIRQAEALLAGRSDKNETYVVFLTDGLPTARYKSGSDTQTQGACQEAYYLNNTVGYTGTDNTNYTRAVSEWKNSTKIANAEGKYVVYVGDTNCKERCETFATAVGATLKSGNSAEKLGDTFEAILKKITRRAYTNVVIQDTLSEYVEYAYQNIKTDNFTVRRIDSEGASKKLTLGTDYTITFSGNNKKTFKVSLLKGGELANNYTYRVQINVIPSKLAIKYKLQNKTSSYPTGMKGDAKTDGPGTVTPATSSGKAGFYSNDNSKTQLSYKAEGVAETAPYEKPVIQVDTTSWSAAKKWVGTPADKVIVSLTAKAGSQDMSYINNILKDRNIELNAGNSWKGTWTNLPKYHYYYNTNGNAAHVAITYTVTEKQVIKDGKDVTQEYALTTSVSGTTTTLTNTRKGILYVEKVWADGADQHAGDAVLVGLYKDGKPASDIYGSNVVTLKKENSWKASFSLGKNAVMQQYTIKELKAASVADYDFKVGNNYYKGIDNGAVTKFGTANYVVEYASPVTATDGSKITITNSPAPQWQIVKRSSSEGNPVLPGAVFTLTGDSGSYKGISDESGIVKWENVTVDTPVKDGTYTLTETQAPDGYKAGASWTIVITKGTPVIDGQSGVMKDGILTFYYDNDTIFYELPSTGGSGIYGYMFGGVSLMAAAALIAYRKRRKEVLGS